MARTQILDVKVSGVRSITSALNRFGKALEQSTASDIWDPVIDLFESFLDDPSEGLGKSAFPGKKGEISYRGALRDSIGYKRSPFKLQVIESAGHGAAVRRGKKATGRFDREVYFWALRKPLGASWVISSASTTATASAYRLSARRMALSVAKKGTSAWYTKKRSLSAGRALIIQDTSSNYTAPDYATSALKLELVSLNRLKSNFRVRG